MWLIWQTKQVAKKASSSSDEDSEEDDEDDSSEDDELPSKTPKKIVRTSVKIYFYILNV